MSDVISGASELTPDAVLSILDEPGESTPVEETPEPAAAEQPVEQPAETPVEPEKEETKTEEKPQESTEEKPAEKVPEGEFDEETGPPRVTEENGKKEWHWEESRAKTIYAGYKEAKQYRDVAPTVQEAQVHRDAYVDNVAMHAHFRSGDPNKIDHFIKYWNRQAPQSMNVVAERLFQESRQNNPTVYQGMVKTTLQDVADQFFHEYAGIPDKENSEEARKLLFAGRMLHWYLGQEWPDEHNIPAQDPTAERLAEVERREADVKKFHEDRVQSQWGGFTNVVNMGIRAAVQADIDEALKPIADLKKTQPLVWKAATNELRDAIRKAISADKSWNTLYGLKYEESKRTMSDADRKDLVTMYRNRARRAIGSVKAKVLSSVGTSVVSQSEQEHKRLEEASKRKEPKGSAPTPAKVGSKDLQGKTLEEKISTILGV